MPVEIFDPYHNGGEPGQTIPQETVEGFWEEYSSDYSSGTLRKAVQLADEAWFKALEKDMEDDPYLKELLAYDANANTTPNSETQGLLTTALIDEFDLNMEEASDLAGDLTKRYGEEEDIIENAVDEEHSL